LPDAARSDDGGRTTDDPCRRLRPYLALKHRETTIQSSEMNYLPLAPAFFLILVGIFVIAVVLIEIRVLRYAFLRTGISSRAALFLLFGSLIGSYINIPVAHFPGSIMQTGEEISRFGVHYIVPVVVRREGTILAVNVGGAVIPVLLSIYLLFKNELWVRGLIATAIIAAIMHMLATPVPGVGIAVPMFIPPVVTAIVAVPMARRHAAALAYVSGSLGTLIGADLLNLGAVQRLGAPVASIGAPVPSTAFFSPASWRCCWRASQAGHDQELVISSAAILKFESYVVIPGRDYRPKAEGRRAYGFRFRVRFAAAPRNDDWKSVSI
jgi:uncharacterized membrane protein